MPWTESPTAWRRTPRPDGWKTLRAQAMARDGGQCTWIDDGARCTEPGTDCDHIGDPDDHSLNNLRMLCRHHHRKRTALQARAARGPQPTRARPSEQHPGMITPRDQTASSGQRAAAIAAARRAARQRQRDEFPF